MRLRAATPIGVFWIAAEERDLAHCPKSIRDTEAGFVVNGQTLARIIIGIDFKMILDSCNRSGYLIAFLEGMRWEQIPARCRRKTCCGHCARALGSDLEAFRAVLEERRMLVG